jgi:hypothetical protein
LKLSDLHVVGNDNDQLNLSMSKSHVDGITVNGGQVGINIEDGQRNSLANIVSGNVASSAIQVSSGDGRNLIQGLFAAGPTRALWLRGSTAGQNAVSNVVSIGTRRRAVFLQNNRNKVSNVVIEGFSGGSTTYEAVLILGNQNVLSNININPGSKSGVDPMTISGNNNIVQNLILHPDITGTLTVSGTETQIWGTKRLSYDQISDDGTRTMINGWSKNGGDPNTRGSGTVRPHSLAEKESPSGIPPRHRGRRMKLPPTAAAGSRRSL